MMDYKYGVGWGGMARRVENGADTVNLNGEGKSVDDCREVALMLVEYISRSRKEEIRRGGGKVGD